jgi:hypothetical protein
VPGHAKDPGLGIKDKLFIAVFMACNSSANAFALLPWNSRRGRAR